MTELLFLRWRNLARADRACLLVLLLAFAVGFLLPAVSQDPAYHRFADQRQWLRIPHAADVLSNAGFALVGLAGVARLASRSRRRFSPSTEASLWCITLGLIGTALGSAWYHRDPTDATLVWDRLPLTLVFAGVLGAAIAQRVGDYVSRASLAVLFELGIATIVYWKLSGNLFPYLTLQFGGIAALLAVLMLTRRQMDPFPWAWVVVWYVLAKVAELADQRIWDATHGVIAGHMLKHLSATAASVAALWPLFAREGGGVDGSGHSAGR